jgi:hypothetical protein
MLLIEMGEECEFTAKKLLLLVALLLALRLLHVLVVVIRKLKLLCWNAVK